MEEIDLYEILELRKGAGKEEIRKAYRRLALVHHPDKVSEADRADADVRFKSISQAYEILYDDEKRALYDQHGMAAFDPSSRMDTGATDVDDIIAQLFAMGGGVGGMGGMGGRPGMGGARRPQKSADDEQVYGVTLEELYKGKTVKFASTKMVNCSHCKGRGGRENAKARPCATCKGQGIKHVLRQQGPFLTQDMVECDTCSGTGEFFYDKDKCKKCKGKRTISERKMLELYIPPGSRDNERIVLPGEADQSPGQEPGDIIFVLDEKEHPVFTRIKSHLKATIKITLAEALCGLNRTVIKTLDGRGLHLDHQKPSGGVLRPGQIIRVPSEGMPIKKSDAKGDLFLELEIDFPDDDFLQDENLTKQLEKILPKPNLPIEASIIDEVDHMVLSSAGAASESSDTGEDGDWEDDEDGDFDEDGEEDGAHNVQCGQQ